MTRAGFCVACQTFAPLYRVGDWRYRCGPCSTKDQRQ